MSDTEKLRKKIQKVSAVLDFYDDLCKRSIHDEKELKDVKLKMDFAKKQMLKLCMESKKIIKSAEKQETV
ncbi:MAG: hypothetical protein KKE20_01315 [Nanoarchaeota archaeon]|nr:hypothetical protein [Nanoarchaeota archaeon]